MTGSVIEVLYNQNCIAAHRRLYGRKGQYSTFTEYMPKDHQEYLECNGDRFRKWAEKVGTNTYKVIDASLRSKRVEQQFYRVCMGILKMYGKYSSEQLEFACETALSYAGSLGYKSISNILAAKKILHRSRIQQNPLTRTTTASPEVPAITGGNAHDQSGHYR